MNQSKQNNSQENLDLEDEKKDQIDILEMLDKKQMYNLEKCFVQNGNGLLIDEFCYVMLEHLDYNKNDPAIKKKITLALIDLFKEIDVNGDGTMEWDEFSQHIISLGMLRNDRSYKDVIKQYNYSENIVDKEKHQSGIEQIYYFADKGMKILLALEQDSPRFKVYDANTAEITCDVNAHKCAVLAAEYIPTQNLIATSSNDLTINLWDCSSFNLKQIISVPEIQLCLRFANWGKEQNSGCKSFLYTGGSDAIVHIYDAETLKEQGTMSGWNPFFQKDSQQYGHAGPIGDILPIQDQQTLVTAGLDANICLWDVATHSPQKELRGHEKGVYSLDWSEKSQVLISAGLDHEAYVWNTYVQEKIFLLRGHSNPLVGVKCLPNSPQVITADICGTIKIWDIRNFLCIQTLSAPSAETSSQELSSFVVCSQPKKRIIVASQQLHYFEYDEPKDHNLTDEKMCIRVLYDDTLLCFITLHPDCIKVWDARDGQHINVFRQLCKTSQNAELTSCVLDKRQRKLIVGDSDGKIFTVNIKNGAKLKKFYRHKRMVSDIVYWCEENQDEEGDDNDNAHRRIVTCSQEDTETSLGKNQEKRGNVYIHDEDCTDQANSVRYFVKQHQKSVNSLSLQKGTETLASCSDDGIITLTNLVSYRQELLVRLIDKEFKKIMFLDPYDCLVATDSSGNIYFFGVQSGRFRNKLIYQTVYKTVSTTNNKVDVFPVTALNFNQKFNYLVLGDEFGNVAVWDISILLQKVELFKEEKQNVLLTKMKKKEGENLKDVMFKGNTEKTEQSEFQRKANQSKNNKNDGIFEVTGLNIQDSVKKPLLSPEQMFSDNPANIWSDADVKKDFGKNIMKAHKDGITWIEVMEDYDCIATASFDCCSHLWSILTGKQMGTLILGHDIISNKWELKINQEERARQADEEAEDMISNKIQSVKLGGQNEQPDEKSKKKEMNKPEKVLEILHEKEFNGKRTTKGEGKDDESVKSRPNSEKGVTTEEQTLNKARMILDQTNQYRALYEEQKRIDDKKGSNQLTYDEYLKGLNFVELDGLKVDKDIYQDLEDEEEDDYQILNELGDYKNQQLSGGAFNSKSAFKTQSIGQSQGAGLK